MEFSIPKNKISAWYKLIILIMVSIMGIASCQTTSTNDYPGRKGGEPAKLAPFWAHIYGKVDSNTVNDTKHLAVFVMNHIHECPDSVYVERTRALAWINKSGKYNDYFGSDDKDRVDSMCAYLVSYKNLDGLENATSEEFEEFLKGYDSLLAGPKIFKVNFNRFPIVDREGHALYGDSVRVDFTVHDSTKRAADDSTT